MFNIYSDKTRILGFAWSYFTQVRFLSGVSKIQLLSYFHKLHLQVMNYNLCKFAMWKGKTANTNMHVEMLKILTLIFYTIHIYLISTLHIWFYYVTFVIELRYQTPLRKLSFKICLVPYLFDPLHDVCLNDVWGSKWWRSWNCKCSDIEYRKKCA